MSLTVRSYRRAVLVIVMRCLLCTSGASAVTLAVFTLEDEQIVWTEKSFGIFPSNVNLCRTVVNLFVSTGKSSWKNRLSRRSNTRRFVRGNICSWKYLFVPFAHQTICSSETIFPSRRFFSSSNVKTTIYFN